MAARTQFCGLYPALFLLLLAQLFYWHATHSIRPQLEIVAAPPSREAVRALSFGDEQFYFRVLAFGLQNSGDTFGRFTALRYYDYGRLSQWFTLLDELDARSDMVPSLAAYYFSRTQNDPDVRHVVTYLYKHATHNIEKKWWWLIQAIYLANNRLNDMDLALKVASPLINPNVPVWAQQMTAIVHEKRGEMRDALHIMETIRQHVKDIPEKELRYMTYFVEERLKALDEQEKQRVLQELKAPQ